MTVIRISGIDATIANQSGDHADQAVMQTAAAPRTWAERPRMNA
jgi:hypothetical protein